MKYYLAIDIGASSGRHIVGWREDGHLKMREVHRFPSGTVKMDGHLTWDVEGLFSSVIKGIQVAFTYFPAIESLSIDTWGVDYVLLDGDQEILPCYAYRDSRTKEVLPSVHKSIPFAELYCRTGCQFQPFNTVYQLWDDLRKGRLEHATDFLMIPEYLMWRLTGIKKKEYTNATTTGLIHAATGDFDRELIHRLGLPDRLFPALSQPGATLGMLKPEIADQVGGQCRVVLGATHDTASAVEGIPMEGNQPYISSGTWSLLGVKTPKPITTAGSEHGNWSNEGGVGYNRYQKNIMGMWLVQRLQQELCPSKDFSIIVREAEQSSYSEIVDTNAAEFLAPVSMKAAVDQHLRQKGAVLPVCERDYFCCAYRSLAINYQIALAELERNTGKAYEKLYIVGGGAKNRFLNELTSQATGKEVIVLPIEATALGNLKTQMEAD